VFLRSGRGSRAMPQPEFDLEARPLADMRSSPARTRGTPSVAARPLSCGGGRLSAPWHLNGSLRSSSVLVARSSWCEVQCMGEVLTAMLAKIGALVDGAPLFARDANARAARRCAAGLAS